MPADIQAPPTADVGLLPFEGMMLTQSGVDYVNHVRNRVKDLSDRLADPTMFKGVQDLIDFRSAVDLHISALQEAKKRLP